MAQDNNETERKLKKLIAISGGFIGLVVAVVVVLNLVVS